MGCQQTKVSDAAKNKQSEQSQASPVDPRLPLTARQAFKLKSSWKGIKRNMEATGVEMFVRLFQQNGHLKTLFKDIRDLQTADELRAHEAVEHHGSLVMSVLDEAISNIDDVDHVIEVCQRTGKSHSKFTGFSPELFWVSAKNTIRLIIAYLRLTRLYVSSNLQTENFAHKKQSEKILNQNDSVVDKLSFVQSPKVTLGDDYKTQTHGIYTITISFNLNKLVASIGNLMLISMMPFKNRQIIFVFKQLAEECFLDAVKVILGDRYTDNMQIIYQVAIKFIIQNLKNGYKSGSQ
ncbi:DgyrCDS11328 [Dimorphilus gyrociliatus]|uniref:DgyrCDS11328 n=1 Tax=Dimorphilus gyrociliatus TaxID=2664684 RepID=A0A7I8W2Z5_9ANNE|nr:DgyrCDS11328 [Dimorphilus gyrociliatus]